MPTKIKALLIAEAANPEWSSVPLVGWSLATSLASVADAHIVTQVRNRDAFLRAGLREGVDFTAIDSEAVARPMWRLSTFLRGGATLGWTTQTAIASLTYPYFEHLVWERFGARIRGGEFDVVHRITPLSPTSQSSLARKCDRAGVAFILGPLNGGVPWPAGFDRERRQEREWLSYVRALYKLLPTRRSTLRYTRALLIGSHHTLKELPAVIRQKCVYLPENAIDPARFNRVSVQLDCPRLRICFVGRLVPYKGPDMLLEAAMPLLRRGAMTLDFVGDGPLMDRLRADVDGEGVSSAVNFHGWVPHTNVQDVMCQCHAMALPSVREFGGGVVLEAMALGVVPIVVDYAGPSELVDSEVGHKIPIGCRPEVVLHLHETLEKLAADPGALTELSRAGRRRVMQHYTWSAKATQVLSVYEWALGRQASKPEFDFRSSVSSVS